jgi:hypothetical protein
MVATRAWAKPPQPLGNVLCGPGTVRYEVIQGRDQTAWWTRRGQNDVERKVLTSVADEWIDTDDRHRLREQPRADGFARRAMIGEDTGGVEAFRQLVLGRVAADPHRLEAAEPQYHFVPCPQLLIIHDEQDSRLL